MKKDVSRLLMAICIAIGMALPAKAQPTRDSIYYYSDMASYMDYSYQYGVGTPDQGLLLAETAINYNPGGLLYSKMQFRKLWGSSQSMFYFSNPSPLPYPDYTQKDYTTCLEKDGSGNYYTGGKYYYDEAYGHDAILIKYNSALTEVWRRYLYSPSSTLGATDYTIAAHVNGAKIYWLGYLESTGYFLSCFSDIGNQLFFVNVITFVPVIVRATAAGDVYLLGTSTSPTNGSQIILQKLNSSGVQVWKKTFNALAGVNADIPSKMEISPAGDIYFTCSSVRVAGAETDGMFVKYNSAGTRVWTKYMSGTANLGDGAGSICFDNAGNITVAYDLLNTSMGVNNNDVCLRKYSAAGSTLATRYYRGSSNQNDHPMNIFYAPNNRYYLTAYTEVNSTKVKSVLAQYDDYLNLEYTDVALHSFSPSQFPVPDYTGITGTTSVLDGDGLHIYWIGTKVKIIYSNGLDNIEAPFIVKYSIPAVPRIAGETNEKDGVAIQMAPNPGTSVVTIGISSGIQTVSVFDLSGKLVYEMNEQHQPEVKLNVESWNTGVYLIRVLDENGSQHAAKFIKN